MSPELVNMRRSYYAPWEYVNYASWECPSSRTAECLRAHAAPILSKQRIQLHVQ